MKNLMTSHFDRYRSIKPVNTSNRSIELSKLLSDADDAIAWGYPNNESMGYSHAEFISIIRRLKNYIEKLSN